MLVEVLQTVRELCDESLEAGEHRHALTLSRLSSTLDTAVRHEEALLQMHVSRSVVDALATEMVQIYLRVAKVRLSDADYRLFERCLNAGIPHLLEEDAGVVRLRKECVQVDGLLAMAVAAKSVGEISRLANLLVVKNKALRKAEIAAGELLTRGQLSPLTKDIAEAGLLARDAIGPEKYDPIVDEFCSLAQGLKNA